MPERPQLTAIETAIVMQIPPRAPGYPSVQLPQMKICYFGTYRTDYARNTRMIAGLRSAGMEVIECQVPLWHDTPDRVRLASGGWVNPLVWLRVLWAYARLCRMHSRVPHYDVMVVGYPGHLDVFLASLLTRRRRKPLVWDVYMSAYLIALDRGIGKGNPLSLRLLHSMEKRALRLPELMIIDTPEYVDWYTENFGTRPDRFRLVPPAVDEAALTRHVKPRSPAEVFRVVYHGTFIPNHGVLTIMRAAQLLGNDCGITFELIGEGPDRSTAEVFAVEHKLAHVEFAGWLEGAALADVLATADICLGAFGGTGQSLITVHNKIYEAMALGRPVISGDSAAVRRAFRAGEEIELVPREDPVALAAAIHRLRADPLLRDRIGAAGRRAVAVGHTVAATGKLFAMDLREVAG